MDRYEYKVREEEIMKLAEERKFAEAAELADTIDWSRVRSVTTLCKISDVYKGARRFQESKEILLMAYKKYPENRRIVYALCLRSIQLQEFVQAIEYYKEFVQIAPRDTDRYILQYKIYEAQDVSLEERAAVLEEYKSKDYKPRWGYELAELYHKMGLGTKCVDECEEFIATFGEGKYVIKAMELKALHEPLSGSEQAEYARYMSERDRAIMSGEEKPKEIPESIKDMGDSTLGEEDIKDAPTAEIPIEEDEIEVKPVDVGRYNTINLQAALAESMKDIWEDEASKQKPAAPVQSVEPEAPVSEETVPAAEEPETVEPVEIASAPEPEPEPVQEKPPVKPAPGIKRADTNTIVTKLMPSTPELGVDDNTIFTPTPLSVPEEGIEDNTIFEQSPLINTGYGISSVELISEPEPPAVDLNPPPMPAIRPIQELSPRLKPEEPAPSQVLIEQTKRIPTDTIVDYLETQKIVKEIQDSTASMQASAAQSEKIPGAITGQLDIPGTGSSLYDQMLAEEYSGQIRLAVAEAEQIEKQITGQLSIDDVLSDWEEAKKENEKKREEEVRMRIVQHTGSLFDEFDEDTKAMLLEQLEKAFRDAILKGTGSGELDEEALGKKIRKEALRTVEYMTADGIVSDDEAEVPAKRKKLVEILEDEESELPGDDEETVTEEDTDTEEAPEDEDTQTPDENEEADEDTDPDEEPGDEESAPAKKPVGKKAKNRKASLEEESVSAVEEALEEETGDKKPKAKHAEPDKHAVVTDSEGNRVLSDEEEELFKPFLNRKGTRKQIAHALDHMSMAAYSGNCIVTGEEGTGTIDLAKRLIKYMQATDSNFLSKQVAIVNGKNINGKDLNALLSKINGGAIIIQSARGLKKSTAQKLMAALDNENLGIMAILEDTSEGMDRIVGTLPKLGEIFNVRIDLQALDDKALVSYACEYALSQEHSIDEFALLAIHTRISEMQTSDHKVTVAEVRDLVDDAIFYADKRNPSHFFDIILHKRYDDEDMIILREKDFMHY